MFVLDIVSKEGFDQGLARKAPWEIYNKNKELYGVHPHKFPQLLKGAINYYFKNNPTSSIKMSGTSSSLSSSIPGELPAEESSSANNGTDNTFGGYPSFTSPSIDIPPGCNRHPNGLITDGRSMPVHSDSVIKVESLDKDPNDLVVPESQFIRLPDGKGGILLIKPA